MAMKRGIAPISSPVDAQMVLNWSYEFAACDDRTGYLAI